MLESYTVPKIKVSAVTAAACPEAGGLSYTSVAGERSGLSESSSHEWSHCRGRRRDSKGLRCPQDVVIAANLLSVRLRFSWEKRCFTSATEPSSIPLMCLRGQETREARLRPTPPSQPEGNPLHLNQRVRVKPDFCLVTLVELCGTSCQRNWDNETFANPEAAICHVEKAALVS